MKNNLLWGAVALAAVILIVVLLGGSGQDVAVTGNNATSTSVAQTAADTKKATSPAPSSSKPVEGMKVSLGGIFNEQGNYECDYESITPSKRTSSVVYVSGGRLRGEFRSTETGKTNASIVVYDGTHLYTWTEGMPTGTVSQPKTLAELPGIIPEDVSSGRILGSGLNTVGWNCHAWSLNPALLVKPSYVQFY